LFNKFRRTFTPAEKRRGGFVGTPYLHSGSFGFKSHP